MPTIPFEQYVAEHEAKARARPGTQATNDARCTCCMRKRSKLTLDGYCHECLRYSWGYDNAEETMVEAMIGGAVKAALANVVPAALIRRVVDDAIDSHNEECAEQMVRAMAKAGA